MLRNIWRDGVVAMKHPPRHGKHVLSPILPISVSTLTLRLLRAETTTTALRNIRFFSSPATFDGGIGVECRIGDWPALLFLVQL
ncbi:MAG: hypothetical protein ACLSCB_11145 [Bifidobacterium pseudocatenulatum]